MKIDRHDEAFVKALTELAYCNPFSRHRLELEQQALGDEYDDRDTQLWSRTLETDHTERANVARLTERADQVALRLCDQLTAAGKVDPRTRELYDGLVTYVLLYRHVARRPLDELYGPAGKSTSHAVWRSFVCDYDRFFGVLGLREYDRAAARALVCLPVPGPPRVSPHLRLHPGRVDAGRAFARGGLAVDFYLRHAPLPSQFVRRDARASHAHHWPLGHRQRAGRAARLRFRSTWRSITSESDLSTTHPSRSRR